MPQILTVITGSKLHGLDNPDSDTDYRGVFVVPLAELVDPFTKPKETIWIEGETQDDTSFELRRFVRDAVHADPNALEILFSGLVDRDRTTVHGLVMRNNARAFLDSERIFAAYKGYSDNQMNKMNLFEPDKRTPKFAVAFMRSLLNGIELLRDGWITNPIPEELVIGDGVFSARQTLMRVKNTPPERFDDVREECTKWFVALRMELAAAYYENPTKWAPDRDWIKAFVREAYGI